MHRKEPQSSNIEPVQGSCHARDMDSQAEPSAQEKQRFSAAMEPRWKEIATALAADRPPEWEGYP